MAFFWGGHARAVRNHAFLPSNGCYCQALSGFFAVRQIGTGRSELLPRRAQVWLFQKQIHAIEIDNGVTVVQRVHPQNPSDSGAAS